MLSCSSLLWPLFRLTFLVVLVLGPAVSARAFQGSTTKIQLAEIRKFLSPNADVVLWLDWTDPQKSLTDSAVVNQVLQMVLAPNISFQSGQTNQVFRQDLQTAGATRLYIAVDISEFIFKENPNSGIMLIAEGSNPQAVESVLNGYLQSAGFIVKTQGTFSIAESAQRKDQAAVGEPSGMLLAALNQADSGSGLAFALRPDVKRGLMLLLSQAPDLDPEIVNSLRGLKFGTLSEPSGPSDLSLHWEFESQETAASFCQGIHKILQENALLESNESLLASRDTQVNLAPQGNPILQRMLQKMMQESKRLGAANQLRQITLALHNYASAFGGLPPQALVDGNGKRLLSWRVLLLPFLDQQELFDQFHLDEPWDSEHNLPLSQKLPACYASPDHDLQQALKPGETVFVAPLYARSIMGRLGKPARFEDVTDGTSNTILFVEAHSDQAVIWSRPADLPIADQADLDALLRTYDGSFLIAFLDGSIRFVPSDTPLSRFLALLSIDGGEVVDELNPSPAGR